MSARPPQLQSQASLSDILTAIHNLIQTLGQVQQAYAQVEGLANFANITQATVIKASGGRICRVSVLTAKSQIGTIFDGATLTATTRPLYVIPTTVGVYDVDLPTGFGILIIPGAGMSLSGSFS